MSMKNPWVQNVVVLVVVLNFGAIALIAQESQKTKSAAVTVTGCLKKGDEAGEFSITGEDGKRYGLHSKAVDLSKHVGHKVTVTGTKMREEKEEKQEAGGGEYADLRVTDIKHISEGCK